MSKTKICPDCGEKEIHISTKRCRACYEVFRIPAPNYCLGCGKIISNRTKRCRPCMGISYRVKKPKKYCPDCGNEIKLTSTHCYSCANKGERHPNWQGGYVYKPRPKTKKCPDCGKLICTRSTYCEKCIQTKMPTYQGGRRKKGYSKEFSNVLRKKVRNRDGNTCKLCGCSEKENGMKLSVHHIDYNKQNNNPSNLISLCVNCHMKTNFQRGFWQGYIIGVMTKQRSQL